MKYLKYLWLLVLVALPAKAAAFCPVCTVAVAAGIGLSRWLMIDDTITGIWIGGLIVSSIGWTLNWFQKKKWGFKGLPIVITLLYYGMIIVPLYTTKIIGHPLNTLWGVDKLVLGIVAGTLGFVLGLIGYDLLKVKYKKSFFHYQKILMVIAPLIIFSLVFFLITGFKNR